MNEKELQQEIRKRIETKLFPLLEEYMFDTGELDAVLKWKPTVMLLGNYSSGKSTLVNELLGMDIQLTGQAPTDDSFTVITAPGENERISSVGGASLVNDDNLPFSRFKSHGEQFASHFLMKLVETPTLENLAIIDSPGMLDSVTEKGRGYDFAEVIGEFAVLADLIVLMFDPHKAGTIKETYTTIRSTLPERSGEDRIIYVMSRIDECDHLGDLMRSYGTLCWNLSQMTGRKDIPRIYLTYSPTVHHEAQDFEASLDERDELKRKILSAPENKIGHILQMVDRKLHELKMATEAMNTLAVIGRRLLRSTLKKTLLGSVAIFFLVAFFVSLATGTPVHSFFMILLSGAPAMEKLLFPLAGFVACWIGAGIWFAWWRLPRHLRESREDVDRLVKPANAYMASIWKRIRGQVAELISRPDLKVNKLSYPHLKNLEKVERFIAEDLKRYFSVNRRLESDAEELDGDALPDDYFDPYAPEYEEEMTDTEKKMPDTEEHTAATEGEMDHATEDEVVSQGK
jgi:GTPase SAR1 family protein